MKVKGFTLKGAGVLGLVMLLLHQGAVAQAKPAKAKLRTSTGMIQSIDDNHQLTLDCGKKGVKTIFINEGTSIVKETATNQDQLEKGDVVAVSGKGSTDQVVVSKLVKTVKQQMRFSKKIKEGNGYGKMPMRTEIKGQIKTLMPLSVLNRYRQTVNLILKDDADIIREDEVTVAALNIGEKVRIKYRSAGDQLNAEYILIPLQPVKKEQSRK